MVGLTLQGLKVSATTRLASRSSAITLQAVFATALASKFTEYRDAITATALQLKNNRAVASEAFSVTPAMRAEVLRRMRAKGVEVTDETYAKATQLVDDQLGYEIAPDLARRIHALGEIGQLGVLVFQQVDEIGQRHLLLIDLFEAELQSHMFGNAKMNSTGIGKGLDFQRS